MSTDLKHGRQIKCIGFPWLCVSASVSAEWLGRSWYKVYLSFANNSTPEDQQSTVLIRKSAIETGQTIVSFAQRLGNANGRTCSKGSEHPLTLPLILPSLFIQSLFFILLCLLSWSYGVVKFIFIFRLVLPPFCFWWCDGSPFEWCVE